MIILMLEQSLKSIPKPSKIWRRKTFIILVLLVVVVALSTTYFLRNSHQPQSSTAKTSTTQKPKGPFVVTGHVDSIDLKNKTFSLVTFAQPKKTYEVKMTERTMLYQVKPGADNNSGGSPLIMKLADLSKGAPLEVTCAEEPSQATSLTAFVVRKLIYSYD